MVDGRTKRYELNSKKKDLFCQLTLPGGLSKYTRGNIYSKLDKIINAEIPRNPATATATAAPPTGKIATNGPSQSLGSWSSVWSAVRTCCAVLHAVAYTSKYNSIQRQRCPKTRGLTSKYDIRPCAHIRRRLVRSDQILEHARLA